MVLVYYKNERNDTEKKTIYFLCKDFQKRKRADIIKSMKEGVG
ncbi:hypothetical protein HOLDEFILI_03198 [Holdemania filiformis DSM 12042]|uniref:Uncharacterized protein n=1 Tax=Holdemania filiformis DSM 12042 TaxID=545696 RepID=B9YBJ1_9FIRM|nr:hypothetical protein HOLDEFILI_03198 [Holdemania filiformis DSM 12042]